MSSYNTSNRGTNPRRRTLHYSILLSLFLFIHTVPLIQCYNPNKPPPPPPPPNQEWNDKNGNKAVDANYKEATPIYYSFDEQQQQQQQDTGKRRTSREDDDDDDDDDLGRGSSALSLYEEYTSTLSSRIYLSIFSSTFGSLIGIFLTKSISILPSKSTISTCTLFYFICTILKPKHTNPYIELIQSLGIVIQQTLIRYYRVVHRQYPTLPHLLSLFQLKERQKVEYTDQHKVTAMIGIFFIGAFVGGTIPFIPTSIGGICGAFFFTYFCTMDNARGDLFRVLSIRIHLLFFDILKNLMLDLEILRKIQRVMNKVIQLCFILDRKHRIYDKLSNAVAFVYYNMIMRIWNSASSNQKKEREDRRRGGNDDDARYYDDRRYRDEDRRTPSREYPLQNNQERTKSYPREDNLNDRRDRYRNDEESYNSNEERQRRPPPPLTREDEEDVKKSSYSVWNLLGKK